MQIKYLSAPTASGKTYALLQTLKHGGRYIIATPRRAISREIAALLLKAGFAVKLIVGPDDKNGNDTDTYKDCGKAFRDAIKANCYEVIIIDHKVALKKVSGVENYDIYIDEIPSIVETIPLGTTLPATRTVISTLFPDGNISDSHLYYDLEYTKEIADLFTAWDEDEAFRPGKNLFEIGQSLKSGDHKVVIRGSQLQTYQRSLETETEEVRRLKLKFHKVLQPEILEKYRSVTVMGANFDNSEMYVGWCGKVVFAENTEMKRYLRSLPDHKKGLVDILYLSEAHDTWASLEKLGYQEFLDRLARAYEVSFPNTKHIFAVKRAKDKCGRPAEPYRWLHEDSELGLRLDPSSKGVNGLQHINVALHLVPINPSTYEYNFRKEYFGMTADDVKWAISYESQYQFASRTSYRDYESRSQVTIIVLDRNSAFALHKLFGEASAGEPKFFDIGIEELRSEKKKPLTDIERQAKSRRGKRIKENETTTNAFQYPDFRIREWKRIESHDPVEISCNWTEFVHLMWKNSRTLQIKSKIARPLYREGYFVDPASHTLAKNIQTSKLIQMDIDKATCDPKELSKFLLKNNLSHLIVSSFSSEPTNPRFHLLIPLSRAVCGDDYEAIFNLIRADIIQKFGGEAFEIEKAFKSFNKRLCMPCVSNYNGEIFIDGTLRNKMTWKSSFLDVERYLNRIQIEDDRPGIALRQRRSEKTDISTSAIDRVIAKLAVPPGMGKGNDNFYQAGVELKKLGCLYEEVIRILEDNRHKFGRGKDRDSLRVAEDIFNRNRRNVPSRFRFKEPTIDAKSVFTPTSEMKTALTLDSFFYPG